MPSVTDFPHHGDGRKGPTTDIGNLPTLEWKSRWTTYTCPPGSLSKIKQAVRRKGKSPLALRHRNPCLSGAENGACPRIGAEELVRHFSLDHVVERLTSTVKWNDIVDVHILDRCDCVAHVVFLIG